MFLKIYSIALVLFLVIDAVWLGVISKNLYSKYMGSLMKQDINWYAAGLFYLLFIAGLTVFVIIPALQQNSFNHALVYGALFGLIAYATYDLTNITTLKNWSVLITCIDLVWGAFICSIVSVATYLIMIKM